MNCLYCNDLPSSEYLYAGEIFCHNWHAYLWLKARVEAGEKEYKEKLEILRAIVSDDRNLPLEIASKSRKL